MLSKPKYSYEIVANYMKPLALNYSYYNLKLVTSVYYSSILSTQKLGNYPKGGLRENEVEFVRSFG